MCTFKFKNTFCLFCFVILWFFCFWTIYSTTCLITGRFLNLGFILFPCYLLWFRTFSSPKLFFWKYYAGWSVIYIAQFIVFTFLCFYDLLIIKTSLLTSKTICMFSLSIWSIYVSLLFPKRYNSFSITFSSRKLP